MPSPIGLETLAAAFPSLAFESPADGVLELVIAHEGRQNSATEAMHRDLAHVWRAIDADEGVRAVLVRGAGEQTASGSGDTRPTNAAELNVGSFGTPCVT